MAITIEQAVKKYAELEMRIEDISKRHATELAPLQEGVNNIKAWLLDQLNKMGVSSVKTEYGTPYKSELNSVKMADAGAFKGHVFAPAVEAICGVLTAMGHPLNSQTKHLISDTLQNAVAWDMVDFRVGKKGVLDYLDQNKVLPPGVNMETIAQLRIRKS